jgi:hypothetical protein
VGAQGRHQQRHHSRSSTTAEPHDLERAARAHAGLRQRPGVASSPMSCAGFRALRQGPEAPPPQDAYAALQLKERQMRTLPLGFRSPGAGRDPAPQRVSCPKNYAPRQGAGNRQRPRHRSVGRLNAHHEALRSTSALMPVASSTKTHPILCDLVGSAHQSSVAIAGTTQPPSIRS